jgi:hypothetical protein
VHDSSSMDYGDTYAGHCVLVSLALYKWCISVVSLVFHETTVDDSSLMDHRDFS